MSTLFDANTASVEDLRVEAEELDDVADALRRCAARGHCPERISMRPPGSGWNLVAALRQKADNLRDLAKLKEAKPINKVAT